MRSPNSWPEGHAERAPVDDQHLVACQASSGSWAEPEVPTLAESGRPRYHAVHGSSAGCLARPDAPRNPAVLRPRPAGEGRAVRLRPCPCARGEGRDGDERRDDLPAAESPAEGRARRVDVAGIA